MRTHSPSARSSAQDENFFELPNFFTGPLRNYASGSLAWTLGGSVYYNVSYTDQFSCKECAGLVQINQTNKSYIFTQDYYTIGQWSKFIIPCRSENNNKW